jgi:hypothetical protein
MKKSHLLILSIFLIAVATSCKKHESDAVPEVKIPKMKTLLSGQWKLTGYYYEDMQYSGNIPITMTLDYFQFGLECLRNSPVSFTPDNKGTVTNTCNFTITTDWKFSADSSGFYYKWNTLNLNKKYDYRFQTFCADSIVMEQADTAVYDATTHYMKYVLVLKK